MSEQSNETMVRVRLVKSTIGRIPLHRAIVRSLGLGKLQSESVLPKRPEIMGQIRKVAYLLEVTEVKP